MEMRTSKIDDASKRFRTKGACKRYICVSGYCDEKTMYAIDKLIIAELQRINKAL